MKDYSRLLVVRRQCASHCQFINLITKVLVWLCFLSTLVTATSGVYLFLNEVHDNLALKNDKKRMSYYIECYIKFTYLLYALNKYFSGAFR